MHVRKLHERVHGANAWHMHECIHNTNHKQLRCECELKSELVCTRHSCANMQMT
jgi:hypothetical protein